MPYCAALLVEGGELRFSPSSGQSPPEFDFLDAAAPHAVQGWFTLAQPG